MDTVTDQDTKEEHAGAVMRHGRNRRNIGAAMLRLVGASIALVGLVLSWLIMEEFLQKMNREYKQPLFMTWWVRCFFAVMYVLWKLWRVFPGNYSCNQVGDGAFPNARPLLILSAVLAPLGMIGGSMWFLSLPRTNIPANNAIYQAAPAFVFILSVPLLREKVTVTKVSSVLLCVGGVALVAYYSYHDQCTSQHNATENTPSLMHHNPRSGKCAEHSTVYGYVFLMIGVLTYSLTQVLIKKFGTRKGDPATIPNGARLVGYIGINTVLWIWPIIPVLHYSGLEPFEWPKQELLGPLFLNAFLETFFQISIVICVSLSSPLFATVGSVLIVPASVLLDKILQGYQLPRLAYVGVALIVIGFAGFTFSEFVAARREGRREKKEATKSLQSSPSHYYDDDILVETQPLLATKQTSSHLFMQYLI